MKWKKESEGWKVPILSWCQDVETGAFEQAVNVAKLPFVFKHVALMGDCHQGYGFPIGGVAAFDDAVCPFAVGVDIGCGMGFIKTDVRVETVSREQITKILEIIRRKIPCGEGHARKDPVEWFGFDEFRDMLDSPPIWWDDHTWNLAKLNLGTLGGGNHFMEIQATDDGYIGLMIHSGSRNLGHKIASSYHRVALELNRRWHSNLPNEELAFFPSDSIEGKNYIRDMNFALTYARVNRHIMMETMKYIAMEILGGFSWSNDVNIHHNYAAIEYHMGQNVWVHRKGATSAKKDEIGIIPGSMGSSSYIVRGLGNPLSFMSCSHGAGRKMGRKDASRRITLEEANKSMEGIAFLGWNKNKKKIDGEWDFGEAPQAYKDIDDVIKAQSDLVDVVMKLRPLGVVKG